MTMNRVVVLPGDDAAPEAVWPAVAVLRALVPAIQLDVVLMQCDFTHFVGGVNLDGILTELILEFSGCRRSLRANLDGFGGH